MLNDVQNVVGLIITRDSYARDGGEELFTKMHCVLRSNSYGNETLKIRKSNAAHLGKKFVAAIFSVIVYYVLEIKS